jgi:hypothetical protein
MISHEPFSTRLRLARALIARVTPSPPVHLADQFDAAGDEVRMLHDFLGAALPLLHPERAWHHRIDVRPSDDVKAYLVAAVLGCTTYCCHLKRVGSQPAIVRLPLRRADCGRCVQTFRRPPADEDDHCDICDARGVTVFVPLAVRHGPALIVGDACSDCANVLGIRHEVSA